MERAATHDERNGDPPEAWDSLDVETPGVIMGGDFSQFLLDFSNGVVEAPILLAHPGPAVSGDPVLDSVLAALETPSTQPTPPPTSTSTSTSTFELTKPAKPKRHRRAASQVDRQFKCKFPGCTKAYGYECSLRTHIRLKHPSMCEEERGGEATNDTAWKLTPFLCPPSDPRGWVGPPRSPLVESLFVAAESTDGTSAPSWKHTPLQHHRRAASMDLSMLQRAITSSSGGLTPPTTTRRPQAECTTPSPTLQPGGSPYGHARRRGHRRSGSYGDIPSRKLGGLLSRDHSLFSTPPSSPTPSDSQLSSVSSLDGALSSLWLPPSGTPPPPPPLSSSHQPPPSIEREPASPSLEDVGSLSLLDSPLPSSFVVWCRKVQVGTWEHSSQVRGDSTVAFVGPNRHIVVDVVHDAMLCRMCVSFDDIAALDMDVHREEGLAALLLQLRATPTFFVAPSKSPLAWCASDDFTEQAKSLQICRFLLDAWSLRFALQYVEQNEPRLWSLLARGIGRESSRGHSQEQLMRNLAAVMAVEPARPSLGTITPCFRKAVLKDATISLSMSVPLPCGCGEVTIGTLLQPSPCPACNCMAWFSFCLGRAVLLHEQPAPIFHCPHCAHCHRSGETCVL